MRLTNYFLPLLKEVPAEASIMSHQYLLRGGMIRQTGSGLYTWLPLGLRVLKKIEEVIRSILDKNGVLEVLMPCVQTADLWRESGRYDDYGQEMLRFQDRHGRDMLFGPTNEELICDLFRNSIASYKNLPINLYHIQWKFRDEMRPRFGLLRCREFLMKDAYSFDLSEELAIKSYYNMYSSYLEIFNSLQLRAVPVRAPTGPIGGSLSHEFHILAKTGESNIYYDPRILTEPDPKLRRDLYAAADEIHDPTKIDSKVKINYARGIEVGHVFYFGTKYSKPMKVMVTDHSGEQVLVHMGSYGIGVSRLVAAIVEAYHDDKGIKWPEVVAPFKFGLVNIGIKCPDCIKFSEELYETMKRLDSKKPYADCDILYDDTKESPGTKLTCMDLIGLPWQIIVGPQKMRENKVELKSRDNGSITILSKEEAINLVRSSLS